jgi:hypothetical protein
MVISMQQDDDPNPNFQTLGLAAFRVLENLIKQRENDRADDHADRNNKRRNQKTPNEHSEDVDRSLCHVTP